MTNKGRVIRLLSLALLFYLEEGMQADFVSILYSFCAKLYGQRRAKCKTEKLVQELTKEAQTEKNTTKEGEKADATR